MDEVALALQNAAASAYHFIENYIYGLDEDFDALWRRARTDQRDMEHEDLVALVEALRELKVTISDPEHQHHEIYLSIDGKPIAQHLYDWWGRDKRINGNGGRVR